MYNDNTIATAGFPRTWKTPGILCYTRNVWNDKSIYAGFDTVTAVSRTS